MVPKGWNKSTLGEIGKWSGGGTPSKAIDAYWTNGTIPWVSPKDMKLKYLSDAEDYITEEAVSNSSTKLYPAGSVLLVTRSGILRKEVPVAIALCPVAVNQDLKVFNPNEKVNSEFLANFLWCYNQRLLSYCAKDGTTVESIDTTALMAFPIVLPPLPEQRKIAQILSTWDKAITTTERLLSNRQQQKKALMQRLLTGKQRFAGFESEWDKVHLKDCATCLDSKRIPLNSEERSMRQGSIPYWGANGILDYVDDYLFNETLVLLAEDGGYFNEFQTRPIACISHGKAWVNNHAHILRAKNNCTNEWLYYSLVHKNILAFVNGGTRAKLNKSDMLMISVLLPSLEEQQKIASVLSAADAEITTIQNQLDNLKQQKKALMQQLLTGKRRVKVDSPALAAQ